jgi:hypothetical protein
VKFPVFHHPSGGILIAGVGQILYEKQKIAVGQLMAVKTNFTKI